MSDIQETPPPADQNPPAQSAVQAARKPGRRGARRSAGRPGTPPDQQAGQTSDRKAAQKTARTVHPLLQRLWELHPRLFGSRFRPLKIGVFEDLMSRHPGEFEPADLKQALAQHVRSTRYLEAVASGDARHDLDGNAVQPAAPEHVQHAIIEVWRRRRGRDAEGAKTWAQARLVEAAQSSGLDRETWLERMRVNDSEAQSLLDSALAELGAQTARQEALRRAYQASGKSVEDFADMYGLDPQLVRDALAGSSPA